MGSLYTWYHHRIQTFHGTCRSFHTGSLINLKLSKNKTHLNQEKPQKCFMKNKGRKKSYIFSPRNRTNGGKVTIIQNTYSLDSNMLHVRLSTTIFLSGIGM